MIFKIRQAAAFHGLADQALHGLGGGEFVGGKNGKGVPFLLRPAGAANAVDIIFRAVRHGIIDDVGDPGDVQTAGGDVGGDNHIEFPGAETSQRFGAVLLGDVAMHQGHFVFALGFYAGRQHVGVGLGLGEDHHALEVGLLQQSEEEFLPLEAVHGIEIMAHRGGGAAGTADFHFEGILQRKGRQRSDLRRDGGREKQRLALLRALLHDTAHIRHEAHVQHPVHFIEDEDFQMPQVNRPLLHEIQQTTGSGDQHIHAGFEAFALFAVAHPAVNEEGTDARFAAVFQKLFFHLPGQFAHRFQDQDAEFSRAAEHGENREGKGGGFPAARLGRSNDIATG